MTLEKNVPDFAFKTVNIFEFLNVSIEEVFDVLTNLTLSKACGGDEGLSSNVWSTYFTHEQNLFYKRSLWFST